MSPDTFLRRLKDGKSNNFIYSHSGQDGMVAIWKFENSLILTWEECPAGNQYDESSYTRDERHVFANTEDLLRFLETNGVKIETFTP